MIEIWKDIKGYEGIYQVSNIGRIKMLDRLIKNYHGTLSKRRERIMIANKKRNGYLQISLRNNGIDKSYTVHRLVAVAFIANPENKVSVNHKNGIKTDNAIQNLEWSTISENVSHSFKTGLKISPYGSSHYRTKFKERDVVEMKNKYRLGGVTMKDIANENNVSVSAISNIINGKRWTHVK